MEGNRGDREGIRNQAGSLGAVGGQEVSGPTPNTTLLQPPRKRQPAERSWPCGVNGAGRAGGVAGDGEPLPAPPPSPCPQAVFETHVASDFPFEACAVRILLYFRPASCNNPNNKLHFMGPLSFQRITKRFRAPNSSYRIK